MKDILKQIEKEIWESYIDENGKADPIIDGIVNLDCYLKSKYKILWILKEPYDDKEDGLPSGGGWNFCKDFLAPDNFYKRMGRSRSTWHPIIYVCYGILKDFLSFDDMEYIRDNTSMAEIIRDIAVINIKKLPGLTRTYYYSSIENAYNKHKSILLKQIEVFNPDIIIGGSTMPLFYNDFEINKENLIDFGSIKYSIKNSRIYISAYHPAQTQITRETYVNEIINAVKIWATKSIQ